MSIRGNSGFIDTDKRFGSSSGDTKGIIQREQHFLERTQGRFSPSGELLPPTPTVWYDAKYVTLNGGGTNVDVWSDQSGNGITASGNGSLNTPLYNSSDATFGGYPSDLLTLFLFPWSRNYYETSPSELFDGSPRKHSSKPPPSSCPNSTAQPSSVALAS